MVWGLKEPTGMHIRRSQLPIHKENFGCVYNCVSQKLKTVTGDGHSLFLLPAAQCQNFSVGSPYTASSSSSNMSWSTRERSKELRILGSSKIASISRKHNAHENQVKMISCSSSEGNDVKISCPFVMKQQHAA